MDIWQVLEIDPTTNVKAIKLAYAKKLKTCKPEVDPEGFQKLHDAYEMALKYAAGEKIQTELNERPPPPNYSEDPVQLAYQVLDKLENGSEAGIDFIEKLDKEGRLDNLDFSQHFQRVLAFNLLSITPGYFKFTYFLIGFFKWEETVKDEKDGLLRIILQNLINQTRPYKFLDHLNTLSKVRNRKMAEGLNESWEDCCAAKILLSPPKWMHVDERIKYSLKNLIITIENHFTPIIAWGINIHSYLKWKKYFESSPNPYKRKFLWIISILGTMYFGPYLIRLIYENLFL